ncbi:hypothetical protein ACJJTC_002829 [Scirpophaga incertulas]
MAVNSATSFVLSSILSLLIFSGMQMYKPLLIKSPVTIMFGGYLASVMFMLFITAIGNLETFFYGKNFHVKWAEVVLSMLVALVAAGMVHRICFTTCLIFSIVTLYYMNKLAQKTYATVAVPAVTVKTRRHK